MDKVLGLQARVTSRGGGPIASDRERLYALFRAVWNNIESPPGEVADEMNKAAEALGIDSRYVRDDA